MNMQFQVSLKVCHSKEGKSQPTKSFSQTSTTTNHANRITPGAQFLQHCSGNIKREHGLRVCVVCSAGDKVVQDKSEKKQKLTKKKQTQFYC